MKNKEEVQQLAEKEYPYIDGSRKSDIEYTNNMRRLFCIIYTQGYTQCQEDMKPLLEDLFSLWQSLAEVGEIGIGQNFTKKYEELNNSLNKQD